MAAAEAQLTTAELDLGYTRVTSPITGLAGNRQVDVGSYVGSPQPTVLTVVSSLDPVRFDFTISEAEYLAYARATQATGRQARRPESRARAGSRRRIGPPARRAAITVVGRGVERRDRHPAPAGQLPQSRTGSSGRVSSAGSGSPITTRKNAILIPQRAVQELQGTYNVFVVGHDSVAQIRAIKPANRVGSDWVITEGLEPADRIVVEGLQKVRDGIKVRPTAAKAAAPDTTAGA